MQLFNAILWLVNLRLQLVTDFYQVFLVMVWCGFPGGTAYSNFFYLANTRTNLPCDFGLHYRERELTVNLLLFASDLGPFFAGALSLAVLALWFPSVLYNPPN